MTDMIDETTPQRPRRTLLIAAAAGLLAVGGAAGAVAVQTSRPSVTMAPATPVAIRTLASEGIVTVRGQVAEIYGNKFILADGTGRALVDTGREGEGGLVKPGEAVTVQGRYDDGFIHAAFLVAPGGAVTALGPLGGPHGPPHGHHGPRDDRGGPGGPDMAADDMPPPPPPPASTAAPAAPAAAQPNGRSAS
ncbi:hypothetical protein [Sphingomonas profundi]|uniref:hypothetical protein n=1 Tax=Alterirhizorhabdus profundi TaxID=2681549 RepID=UPI001E60E6B4|nr:hypothetical protein [Sphingomonas profundi]